MKKSAVAAGLLFKFMRFFTLSILSVSLFLTMAFAETAEAQGLNVPLDFAFKGGKLVELFKAIEKQVPLTFVYTNRNKELFSVMDPLVVKGKSVDQLLQQVLLPRNLSYKIINNKIYIQQSKRVEGRVTDGKGEPLVGALIREKGTQNETASDGNGKFALKLVSAGAVLEIRLMGYTSKEIVAKEQLLIVLNEESSNLSEVVVTALGIRREEKSLGYAVGTVKGEEVNTVKEINVANALAAKIPGVSIVSTSPDPGASVLVTIRGQSSLATDNQPLYVVDGVPVAPSLRNPSAPMGRSAIDYGSPIADINPDDIENITVLKGASAAALYGSRAGSGVILITTKSAGRKKKGFGIDFNSTAMYDQAWLFPKFQNIYGAGDFPTTTETISTDAWGPRLDQGTTHEQWNSPVDAAGNRELTPWVSYPDRHRDFFQTGATYTNNLAISNSSEIGSYRLSYTNLNNTGIVPNTDLKRNTLNLAANYKLHPKLQINTNLGYTNNKSDNRPAAYRESVSNLVYRLPANIDINQLRNYWVPGKEGLQQFSIDGEDNPYFVAYEHTNAYTRDRLTGNIQALLSIRPDLQLMVRTGMDLYNEEHENKRPFSSKRNKQGAYSIDKAYFKEQNTDVLLTYTKQLNQNWFFSIAAGANRMDRKTTSLEQKTESLSIPEVYNISNATAGSVINSQYQSSKRINSVYAIGQVNFKDQLYVDFTGRNDWSSTLPAVNNSYFYPSISTSVILSDLLKFDSSVLSFAKIRANWAQVGSDTDPYQLYNTIPFGTDWGDVKRATIEFNLKNNFLKPEIATSYEFGADLRFFQGRIGIDATWYRTNKRNQIINIPTTIASGSYNRLINAGNIQNEGIELALNAVPVKNGKFSWNTTINFTKNKNKVIELMDGLTEYSLGSADGDNIRYLIKEGTAMGDFYTPTWQKIAEGPLAGEPLLDQNGRYQRNESEYVKAGNYNPDFMVGFSNTFTYKNLSLNILLDARSGGDFYSYVVKSLLNAGLTTNTLAGRDEQSGGLGWTDSEGRQRQDGMIIYGYIQQDDGSYTLNKNIIAASDYYESTYNKYYERLTYDASFIKLREASLTYVFNQKTLGKLPLYNLSISIIGRNLYNWTKNKLGYDPETTMSIASDGFKQGVGHWTLPGTRSYGAKLSFNF